MIELQALQKTIDQTLVLDIQALTVAAGQIIALVGPEGSGKAPLIELLIGRTTPTLGTLRLAGLDPRQDKEQFSQRVGVLFAQDSLYQRQSSRGNLNFYCRLRGLPKSRAAEILTLVGLADQANARLDKLAPGLARRLAFGRAILHQPSVLLLIEPFNKCDQATISLLGRLIRQQAADGVAVLILADDDAHLAALCDAIHVLRQGQIVESYQPEQERQAALPFKIPARQQDKVVLVNPADILYALAQQGRAVLQTARGPLPTQFTLGELEERLGRSGFFRAHRGYLVNLQHVKEVIPYTRNSFSLILDDDADTEIPLSKTAARELRELLGY